MSPSTHPPTRHQRQHIPRSRTASPVLRLTNRLKQQLYKNSLLLKNNKDLSRYSCQLTPQQEIFAYRLAQLCSHNVSGVFLLHPRLRCDLQAGSEAKPGHVAWMCLMVLLCFFYLSSHKSLLLYLCAFSFPLDTAAALIKEEVAHGQLSATEPEQKRWKLTIKQGEG